MKIIDAKYILTCNSKFEILENSSVCFDARIIEIGKSDALKRKYPQATHIKLGDNSVLMPGLINPHVHLEFSANQSTLVYGDFISWLLSVIANRDELIAKSSTEIIAAQLELMCQSGTTSIGAISSFGDDLSACVAAKQRVVFFVELLGSRPDAVDILFAEFKSKLRAAQDAQNERFTPAIAIHAPYSTHPILAKNALDIARDMDYVVSTHFMESMAERNWLDNGTGDFNKFFENFAPNARPMCNGVAYLELFKGTKALFTHCVQACKNELEAIKQMGGYITHCPVSNRLLGVGSLDISQLHQLTLGTDGLSSNISLNLWDELRALLFIHSDAELIALAKKALKMVTSNAAAALNLECGELRENLFADMIALELPDGVASKDALALQLILHTKTTQATFIAGERI